MQILLKNANIIDTANQNILFDYDVLVIDNFIAEVDKDIKPDGKAQVFNLSGKWIMPGLINMHEHQSYKRLIGPLYGPNGSCTGCNGVDLGIRAVKSALFSLKNGITTICEMGSLHGLCFSMKKAIENKVIPGPRMYISGQHITMKDGHSHELAYEVSSVEEMNKAANYMLDQGSDWVKLLTSDEPVVGGNDFDGHIKAEMPEELVAEATRVAHERGKKCAVHAMGQVQIQRCINAGVDAIHHCAFASPEQTKEMAEKGIAFVSTISAYRNTSSPSFERGKKWAEDNMILRPGFKTALQYAMDAGTLIAPGTDSLGDLVDELEYMNLWGMSIFDCLTSVTVNSAKILGEENRLGTVSPGKLADLVVLSANPSEDLENLRAIDWVMKNGDIYHLTNLSLENTDPRWLLERAPMDVNDM